ncbi:MAG: extracellular solute-binding protein family 3 [Actinomycetia bacterium]|nr:extracellular solute-binding protein family 3 [Actinomycetes bacterium]
MRRWLSMFAALAFAGIFAACGSSSNKSSSTTTIGGNTTTTAAAGAAACSGPADAYDKTIGNISDFKPVTPDTLTIVTSLPGPGFWEGSDTDPTKVKAGYEYDIAKAIQAKLGLSKFVVRNVGFDAIVAGTVTKYDLALSQISITCDRAKVVKFTMPYFQSNQGVLVKKGGGISVSNLAEAKKIQWGVQTGTTAIDLLKKIAPAKSPRVYQQLPDAYTALSAGQVDAVLIDTAINLGEAARSNGQFEVVSQFDQPGGPDQYGAILPKDSTNTGAINAVFKQLEDSGQIKQLATRDLTADPGNIPVIKVS